MNKFMTNLYLMKSHSTCFLKIKFTTDVYNDAKENIKLNQTKRELREMASYQKRKY